MDTQSFAVRKNLGLALFFALLGARGRGSSVEVDDRDVIVRFGVLTRLSFARNAISAISRLPDEADEEDCQDDSANQPDISGHLRITPADQGLVQVDFGRPVRGRVFLLWRGPVTRLILSMQDPDALAAALAPTAPRAR